MQNTRFIHIRVNNQQLEEIKGMTNRAGKKFMSDYIRDVILNETSETQQMIREIHKTSEKMYELLLNISEGKCQQKTFQSGNK